MSTLRKSHVLSNSMPSFENLTDRSGIDLVREIVLDLTLQSDTSFAHSAWRERRQPRDGESSTEQRVHVTTLCHHIDRPAWMNRQGDLLR